VDSPPDPVTSRWPSGGRRFNFSLTNPEVFVNILNSILGKIFHPQAANGVPASIAAPSESPASTSAPTVDIDDVLSKLQKTKSVALNWRSSIVDLMKLLDLDSGLPARKQLAQELGYTGSTDDSATMNLWLIKEVMNRLAQNGGKVPDELKH
jgi:hypothetical protein